MEYVALTFGTVGFVLAVAAYHKADKIEKELTQRKLLDESFDVDR
jgi:hypothetical protein